MRVSAYRVASPPPQGVSANKMRDHTCIMGKYQLKNKVILEMRKNQLGQKKTNYAKDTQCVSEKKVKSSIV